MGAIAFSSDHEHSWVVAGWAFRQVLDDVMSQHRNDRAMAEAFIEAGAIGGLMIHMLEPGLAKRATCAIKQVASEILSGSTETLLASQPYGDAPTIEQYRRSLKDLLRVIPED